ncbi:hypothetical protein [Xylanimonas ulmi]|uniref:Excreted virulence factor EspC (Type VII ESX diderm) n=1 Tax=Xylanimonas ulmi TaxID=228973 RepID=A0A4Q7M8R9_9MICO|nr:hypothetical protein [Xylanibacterium ulmi]RZS63108.1 hypothetical protein EV386_3466 [Xylanibacterium ulmi]
MASGYDLEIDMTSLRELADDLQMIMEAFEDADDSAESARHAIGHDELSGVVEDFADKWRVKRGKMTEAVTTLQGVLQGVVDKFTEVDAELAKALEDASRSVGRG